jgi:pseudaminic acid cytidylyltransferase
MIIAVIPARGGSKRIPRKNIKLFRGRPMIEYSIEAARQSSVFDAILCSTDDPTIAAAARAAGAQTPFTRPPELADDHTPTAPVLMHALRWCLDAGWPVKYLCCIYATAPFVRATDLLRGLDILRDSGVSSAFSVTTFPFPIFRALKLTPEGRLAMFWPEHELTRSQDLPEAYHDAGQFYWLRTAPFLETSQVYTADARPVILPRHRVQDIDTPEDWERAEHMHQALESVSEKAS